MSVTTTHPDRAKTLPGLFRARLAATPDKIAYRSYDIAAQHWETTTWATMAKEIGRWQASLQREKLKPGDCVAIMLRNCREWVVFDQAALGMGLVTVPLYTEDRPENAAYIMRDAKVKLLLVEGKRQWQKLQTVSEDLKGLKRIVSVYTIEAEDQPKDSRLVSLTDWVFGLDGPVLVHDASPTDLATIVYTSGTTGKPKGVMLSHDNILFNAYQSSVCGRFTHNDRFLSFLPLSHMLERTGGFYLPMMVGAEVAFARSVNQLAEDLKTQQPTVMISVPRIYERVYTKIMASLDKQPAFKRRLFDFTVKLGWKRYQQQQGRASYSLLFLLLPLFKWLVARKVLSAFGGRMKYAVVGGAAMPPEIAQTFIGLGMPLLQGYGMTETSPVVCVNRPESNIPESIGQALTGVEVRIGKKTELLTRSRSVMLGYWNNKKATRETIDEDGWLHTGDLARMDEYGHLYITGRIKEIIILGNGEKVPPADMEMAILMDPLIEQVMIIGEARAFLTALVVLAPEKWIRISETLGVKATNKNSLKEKFVEKAILARIAKQIEAFPGYATIRRAHLSLEPWTIDNGLLTPTLKIKRPQISMRYQEEIEALYANRSDK
ncbi:MAG: long-chain fatty acid--CoA ligase [Thiothrix sp.]|nr:MAG: long-chain fatty acid--CoA ligase [Thiothrix sp.]